MKFFKNYGLFIAWLIALSALLGTLYGSEIMSLPVCNLCWYQRICIYPLTILLGIAIYRNEKHIIPYTLPFPLLGLFFAVYQYLEQMIPGFSPIRFCTQGVQCSDIHMKLFGFVTLPFLSALACLVMIFCLFAARE